MKIEYILLTKYYIDIFKRKKIIPYAYLCPLSVSEESWPNIYLIRAWKVTEYLTESVD